MNCTFLAYILSQYLWVFLLGLCLISTYQFNKPISTGDIISNSNAPYFNNSQDPIWFLHFTDIHLSSKKNNYLTILERFNRSLSIFSPDHIAVTGDIADNYRGDVNPIYYEQMEEDWKLYTQLLTDLDNYFNEYHETKPSNNDDTDQEQYYKMSFLKNPLHVAGNHDVFNIKSFNSKKHFANGILYNKSTSVANNVKFNENITFVTINPFSYPEPSTSIIWWISPTRKILSEINNLLQEVNENISQSKTNIHQPDTSQKDEGIYHQTIVLGHYPSRMWFPSFSSTLSSSNNNVRIYLCGHRHPTKPRILHHGQAIEVVGTPLFRYNEVGILSSDNGHFSYHQVNLNSEKFAFLTYPNPDSMKSSMERFDEPIDGMEVRAVSFSSEMNLSFQLDGGLTQKLDCNKQLKIPQEGRSKSRLNDQVFLCTKKLSKSDAKSDTCIHTLTKVGDWDGTVTFTVGDRVNSFEEENYFDEPCGSFIACYFIFYVFLLMVSIPFKFLHFADRFDDWLERSLHHQANADKDGGKLNWILATVGGFFVVESRVARSPLIVRILINLALLWVLVFPFCFFRIEDGIAVYWLWGFIDGTKSSFMATPARFGCLYLIYVVAPFVVVVSGVQHTLALFSSAQKKSNGRKSGTKKGENELQSKLTENDNLALSNESGTVSVGQLNDSMATSSDNIIGLGIDLTGVNKLTLFKRGCVVLNALEVLVYFACFYQCYLLNKELAKDFGNLFGYSSFLFTVFPVILFVTLVIWIVSSSLNIYRHRFDFTVSSMPLEKEEL